MKNTEVFFRDGAVEGRERGKEGKSNKAERRENTEREAIEVNGKRLETLKLYSLQRRRDRYSIIYV